MENSTDSLNNWDIAQRTYREDPKSMWYCGGYVCGLRDDKLNGLPGETVKGSPWEESWLMGFYDAVGDVIADQREDEW